MEGQKRRLVSRVARLQAELRAKTNIIPNQSNATEVARAVSVSIQMRANKKRETLIKTGTSREGY